MSQQRPPVSELLPLLAAAFPHTFFTDPKQVRPLKINIHDDRYARFQAHALPAEIDPGGIKRFLRWYTQRAAYLKALARGESRVDLTGADVDPDIPEAIREQSRAAVQRQQAHRAAQAATPAVASSPPTPTLTPVPMSYPLENLYAMAVDAKLEVTLKFSTVPNAKPAGQGKMAFALKTPDGQFVTAEVSNKAWKKLSEAAQAWPSWTAALSGTMGARTDQGFTLANPGLQVFEKKAKAVDSPAPAVSAPTPAPTSPPPPATPVTVTTGAGTATVTKRAPLSLKRNASS